MIISIAKVEVYNYTLELREVNGQLFMEHARADCRHDLTACRVIKLDPEDLIGLADELKDYLDGLADRGQEAQRVNSRFDSCTGL